MLSALRSPSPVESRKMHGGFSLDSEGSGAPCARAECPGPRHQESAGTALGPEKFLSAPPPPKPGMELEPDPGSSLPGLGQETARPPQPRGRQHKHSSVLYSPPN